MAEILGHLDELVNADRVVTVSVHKGEGLVALLNSVHLLPVFVSLFSSTGMCVKQRAFSQFSCLINFIAMNIKID